MVIHVTLAIANAKIKNTPNLLLFNKFFIELQTSLYST
jgi:hypothetical protein